MERYGKEPKKTIEDYIKGIKEQAERIIELENELQKVERILLSISVMGVSGHNVQDEISERIKAIDILLKDLK